MARCGTPANAPAPSRLTSLANGQRAHQGVLVGAIRSGFLAPLGLSHVGSMTFARGKAGGDEDRYVPHAAYQRAADELN
jgi:hypothetical protein